MKQHYTQFQVYCCYCDIHLLVNIEPNRVMIAYGLSCQITNVYRVSVCGLSTDQPLSTVSEQEHALFEHNSYQALQAISFEVHQAVSQ